MIAEAIDTMITLGWALMVWIVLTAVFATLALYAVVVTVWRTIRALQARARRRAPASRPRPPVLEHEQSNDLEEAA